MKKILVSLVIAGFMSSVLSYADVWVVHNDGKVYSLSEQNDAVVPKGYKVDILKGSIGDLALSRPIDEYIFDGKNFKVNAKAVKAKEDKQLERDQEIEARKAKKKSAEDKLKALGLTDDEVNVLTERE